MIRRFAMLLSISFLLILAACGGTGNNTGTANSKDGAAEAGITADEELIISATNYSFDQNEYHLKKGVPVNIVFKNESGNHGILVPELNLRLDGKDSSKVIVPEEAGTFEMTCAIMCGSGHSGMSAKVIVE
ncbi:cytochrome C oxidase subunit II [Paenibacillus jilunlii]|uniref:Cytochrome C oxidase subunit II n=1 Tax=Paenibacillus jilunlii TaxID=682956 RepID=A0A1G9PZ61_9BACL|nr:cytochrome C oxidase subunit II [Paenibacillus jilunlii]KWX73237.1 cytochrome C oxidase subunit II [Paenibacillus jilunlii]SDM04040.1 cytochrome c oxidase subunit 2 [Paenibacillus jilunlii]